MIELPGYDYHGPLGKPGNFGSVYHATNSLSGQEVAIKHIDQAMTREALATWQAEAHAMAAFEHDHVVRIFHAELTADGPALVMEYLPEGSVAAKYGDDPVPVSIALQIAIDACWGLHQIHIDGLTHRDIKPANLLLSEGRAKLGDLGLAAALGDAADVIYTAHKPPEVGLGDPWTVAADIYALSVTAWRLLWGDARSGRHDADTLSRATAGEWPDRAAWPLHVHKRLRTTLRAGLHPDPHKRPSSATNFRTALEKSRPVVSWVQVDDATWHGQANDAEWFVRTSTGATTSRIETIRDLGKGARRVRVGCMEVEQENLESAVQIILEAVAVDGRL